MSRARGAVLSDRCAQAARPAAAGISEVRPATDPILHRTGSTQTPAAAVTIPFTSTPTIETSNSATPSIDVTLAVARPAKTSSRPGQLDGPRDRTRGHDDQKDGKK